MGRGEDNEIVLSDVGVSRRHARIIVNNNTLRVEDLKSGNGTFVRGQRVERQPLSNGDEIVIDPFVIQVRFAAHTQAEHTQQVPLRARLDVATGPALAQTTYPIPARGLTVGRSDTRDVIIPDPAGSRHHCSIFLQQQVHVLRDMGSANGLYVNGQRVDECTLNHGDIITIGNTELKYVSDDAARQASALRDTPSVGRPSRGSDALSYLFIAATILIVGLLTVLAAASVVLFRGERLPQVTTLHSTAPEWTLTLDAEPTTTDPTELFQQGVDQVKDGDHREALEKFWLVLRERPGNESAEVFAYAAGEHLLLDAMRPELYSAVDIRAARESQRDQLLASGSRASRRTLESDFSDDPIVRGALNMGPSPITVELQTRLTEASALAASGRCGEAVAMYDEILMATADEALRQGARSGHVLCRRDLARTVHEDWATGVHAQATGDTEAARTAFRAVLDVDPSNPSAQFRLDLLQ